jgi:hypothetical protein
MSEAYRKDKLALAVEPLWERQPGETPTQFMWFIRYKEERLAGGSLTDVQVKYRKKPGYAKVLALWSFRNRWVSRIEAYRDYLEHEKEKQRLKDIAEMGERQSRLGKALQGLAMAWLAAKSEGVNEFRPEAIARFIEVGSRLEREARGEKGGDSSQRRSERKALEERVSGAFQEYIGDMDDPAKEQMINFTSAFLRVIRTRTTRKGDVSDSEDTQNIRDDSSG